MGRSVRGRGDRRDASLFVRRSATTRNHLVFSRRTFRTSRLSARPQPATRTPSAASALVDPEPDSACGGV